MQLVRYLVYSNTWIALGAPALIGISALEMEIPYPLSLATLSFFLVLLSYNFQRWLRWNAAFAFFSRRTQLLLGLIAGMASLPFLFFLEKGTLLALFPLALISLFYALPKLLGKMGLRDLPFLKVFLIAFSWAFLTVPIPVWASGIGMDGKGWTLFAERALFFIAITIPFDIRDLKRDAPSDRTWPQVIGVQNAKRLALGILSLFLLSVLFRHSFTSNGSFPLMMGYLLSVGITAPLIAGSGRERDELYYTGLLDGTMHLQSLALLLFGWLL